MVPRHNWSQLCCHWAPASIADAVEKAVLHHRQEMPIAWKCMLLNLTMLLADVAAEWRLKKFNVCFWCQIQAAWLGFNRDFAALPH